jgi:hypothetical protein
VSIHPNCFGENRMAPRAILVLVGVLICSNLAHADPLTTPGLTIYGNAPTGHLQPRAPRFSPDNLSDRVEQQRESGFDAKERELNEELNKKLNICRC